MATTLHGTPGDVVRAALDHADGCHVVISHDELPQEKTMTLNKLTHETLTECAMPLADEIRAVIKEVKASADQVEAHGNELIHVLMQATSDLADHAAEQFKKFDDAMKAFRIHRDNIAKVNLTPTTTHIDKSKMLQLPNLIAEKLVP